MKFGKSEEIVKACDRQRKHLWDAFERIKPGLVEIARHFYPKAVSSLTLDIRNCHDKQYESEDDINRMTGVPIDAFKICVNGFYVNLTSPSARWFKVGNPKFGKTDPAQDDFYGKAYEELTNATDWLMKWCGAYKDIHTVYKHLIAFGFAGVLATPDNERYVHVQAMRIGTFAMGVDRKGKVNRVVRHFAFTAEQMIDEFGIENVSEQIAECAKRGDTTSQYEVWNLIEPHVKRIGIREPYTLSYSKFKYRSVYWCNESTSHNHGLLSVRGYEIKPFVCPRINHENGDTYGRGFCADAIGHARALQSFREDCLDIDDQNAHPSMMAPASMADDGVRLDPLSINYYPDGAGDKAVYRTIRDGLDTSGVREDAAIAEMELRKILFNSEFETINAMNDSKVNAGDMTATEVTARVNEKMEQLSGVATTLNDEWLDPFVTMMANYVKLSSKNANVRGALPGIVNFDEAVINSNAPFDIKYESKIHAAANAQIINAGFESLQRAASFAQTNPDILDNFDLDEVARDTHRMIGARESWLRDTDERDSIREERAAAQQQQIDLQNNMEQAKALKDVASTPVDPSVLGGQLAGAGMEGGVL